LAIVDDLKHRCGGSEQSIKDPFLRIKPRFEVHHASIVFNAKILHVAACTPNLVHQSKTLPATVGHLAYGRFKIVQEIKFHEVN
jgi:hypothetical protein